MGGGGDLNDQVRNYFSLQVQQTQSIRIAGYKINEQKSPAFLYNND